MTNEKPKIHESMCAIMADCGVIGKDQHNSTQNFNFRGIDDVYNALHDIFAKNKVFIMPTILKHHVEERTTIRGGILFVHTSEIRFDFVADDGSRISATTIGEAADSGDKGATKAASIALKYALFQVFLIPTKETPDADADSHDLKPKGAMQAPQEKKPSAKKAESPKNRTLTADEITKLVDAAEKEHPGALEGVLCDWGCNLEEIRLSQKKEIWADVLAAARVLRLAEESKKANNDEYETN